LKLHHFGRFDVITRDRADESFAVTSYESDFTGHLSVYSIFNRFQELAGRHAESLGVGFHALRELNLAWLLSRIQIQVHAFPRWGESVTLYTWPKGIDRLFALRDFALKSAAGDTLVLATTCWLLVDLEKERPCRIESLRTDLNFPHAEHAIDRVPDKIVAPPSTTHVLDVHVLASDLDVNNHVNNAHYARWVTDCFSVNQRAALALKSLQINYVRQVLEGESVSLATLADSPTQGSHYVQGLRKTDGSLAFQAVVQWGELLEKYDVETTR
jgi:medium-chain acyl-[acyl-carrier-protein] hydrolase